MMETVKWISVKDRLPEPNQLCDVWVNENGNPHRRNEYEFVTSVGVGDKPAFQARGFNALGLYEMAYFLEEGIITHWTPTPIF